MAKNNLTDTYMYKFYVWVGYIDSCNEKGLEEKDMLSFEEYCIVCFSHKA